MLKIDIDKLLDDTAEIKKTDFSTGQTIVNIDELLEKTKYLSNDKVG